MLTVGLMTNMWGRSVEGQGAGSGKLRKYCAIGGTIVVGLKVLEVWEGGCLII